MRAGGAALAAAVALGGLVAGAAEAPRSGYEYQAPQTRAVQDDDLANPGMLWVLDGEALWKRPERPARRACADCHGDAAASMRGVAARYPAVDGPSGRLLNLEMRIGRCRTANQGAPALAYESRDLLALTAFVAHQSRGLPIAVAVDGAARPFFEAGRRLYHRRQGQLDLACHHCHERNAGRLLRGERLSQGQATGYPIYRLEWQGVGSLHRRLRSCSVGVRAEPFPPGSPEHLALELYLAWRAHGLPIETPAVRR